MIRQASRLFLRDSWLLLTLFLVLVFYILTTPSAQAAPLGQFVCGTNMIVSDEAELNDAIACYNAATTPGEYVITLTANIPLTASTTQINNTTLGVSLRIEGATHSVDGQEISYVRPFEIAVNTLVTMQAITITRGNGGGGGGGIANQGTLTVTHSIISHNTAEGGVGGGGSGGGIYNGGTLSVIHSTISHNTAEGSRLDNFGGSGGGIYNFGTLIVSNSTISHNTAKSSIFGDGTGGGILNSNNGTLTVSNSTVSHNTAEDGSGSSLGGGIFNFGTLTVSNSTFSHNSAGSGAGIYTSSDAATLTLANTIIANSLGGGGDCFQSPAFGGVVNDLGHNLIEDGANTCGLTAAPNNNLIGVDPQLGPLQDNGGPTETIALLSTSPAIDAGNNANTLDAQGQPLTTDQRGSGFARIIDANGDTVATVDIGAFEVQTTCSPFPRTVSNDAELNDAIACYNAATTPGEYLITLADDILLTASTTTINNATLGVSLRIDGATFSVDGQEISNVRPFEIATNTLVTMQAITITRGNSLSIGGGIFNGGVLTVTHSTLSHNTAENIGGLGSLGGGIYNFGTLTVIHSTISHNTAEISTFGGDGGGGGIVNLGTLTVTHSTISHNTAEGLGLGGGGILNGGTLTVSNSTISHNTAEGGGLGGGIHNNGPLAVTNSTFSHNSASTGAGIYTSSDAATLTLANTIIANSLGGGGDCFQSPAFGGVVNDLGHNLIEDGANTCGLTAAPNNNLIGVDPQLGPLQDNGGSTETHALPPTSPAINKGSNAAALDAQGQPLTTDQRGAGFPRILHSTVDIGAFEASTLCPTFPALVADQAELDVAILCYNAATTPGEYIITLADDILLTASTTQINNTTLGVSLRIDGATHSVDGQEISDVRPFEITANTLVTMQAITITRGNSGSGGGIFNQGTLTVTHSTISHNTTENSGGGRGGGIFNEGALTVIHSTINHNTAEDGALGGGAGGGILNWGVLTVTHSTISHNTAAYGMGGGSGGGIMNGGTLTVSNSTLSHNTAENSGGGIVNEGALTVINSTVSHNTAEGSGGGIYNSGTLTVTNSTLSHNTASTGAGIYTRSNAATLILANTIIANSLGGGGDCFQPSAFGGVVNDLGHNLIEDGANTCGLTAAPNNNIIGEDPNLGPLQDNGGATFTHALLPGSPAIDKGSNAICADSATVNNLDQREIIRPQGARCDIGAYEADTGAITFVKSVVGGVATATDWTFTVSGGPTGIAHNQTVTFTVDGYVVSESGPAEYTVTAASGACALVNGSIELTVSGHGGTCTLTNTRKAGQITFIKDADGGAADDNDWQFTLVSGPAGAPLHSKIANQQALMLDTGTYVVTESGPADYHLKSAEGVCAVVNGQIQLTVSEAGGICEVDNDRDTGKISFRKQVASGPALPSEWTFSLSNGPAGAGLPSGIAHNTIRELDTGSYLVTEAGPVDYALVDARGACALVDGQVRLTVTKSGGICTLINEQATVRVNEFYGASSVQEGASSGKGSQACTWLSLSHAPSGPVTVSLATRDGEITIDKSSITLDASNWHRFDLTLPDNIFCVTAVDDAVDDGGTQQCKPGLSNRFGGNLVPDRACGDGLSFVDVAVTASADPRIGSFSTFVGNTPQDVDGNPASIDVLVQDNDTAGVKITPNHLSVVEGGSTSYTVVLTSQPTAPVTVSNGERALVFDPTNWNVPQTIQITIPDNDLVDGSRQQTILHTVGSSDEKYNGLATTSVTLLILDNDSAGVQLDLIDGQNGQLIVLEGGQTASYTLQLTAQPTAEIVVTVVVDGTQLSASQTSVTFTPTNWDQPQTIVVTAVDDQVAEESLLSLIQHTVSSSDPTYDWQLAPTVEVLVLDNDEAGINASPTSHTVAVGAGGSYTVVLTSQPTVPVQLHLVAPAGVTLLGSCASEPAVAVCLIFTPENWSQPQTVSFLGQQAGNSEIEHTIVTSDPHYLSLSDPVVVVTVSGDEAPSNGNGNTPTDSDGDGIPDSVECPGSIDCPDTDGNGVPDYLDPNTPGGNNNGGENNGGENNGGNNVDAGQTLFLPMISR